MTHCTKEDVVSLMQQHIGMLPERLTSEVLKEAGCLETVCVLPKDLNERTRYLGNLLSSMVMNADIKDSKLKFSMSNLACLLSHMLNSTSWTDGKLYDFDLMELESRLRRIA